MLFKNIKWIKYIFAKILISIDKYTDTVFTLN